MIYDIPTNATDVPSLEDYLSAAKERWRLILLVLLTFVAAAIVFDAIRVPNFEGEARVLANPSIETATGTNPSNPVLEREREVLAGVDVATRASDILDGAILPRDILEDLEVQFIDSSDTLEVVFPDPDAERAANVVNAMVDAYVEDREAGSLAVFNTQIESLNAEIVELDVQLDEIATDTARLTQVRNVAARLPNTDPSRQTQIDTTSDAIALLNQERAVVSNSLNATTRDLRVIERQLVSRRPAAEVIQYAQPPEDPSGPGRSLLLAGAIAFGLVAGIGLAFVLDRLDRTAKDSSDVELAIGTTVLGNIPKFNVGAKRGGPIMLSANQSVRSQRVREAYRRLRASVQFLQSSRQIRSLLVTSATPGEGKSSTVANLAVAAAQGGNRVVIVSGDLRRPMADRMFGVTSSKGLSDHLLDPSITDIMVPIPDLPSLTMVPSGPLPSNPGELLGSPRFSKLIEDLSDQFDLVLVDMPPVLSTADAGIASPYVDGVIVVVDSEATDTDSLLKVKNTIDRSGGTIVGAILNKDSTDSGLSLRRDRYAYEKVASNA